MANDNKAVGYLEINSKQWDDALAMAGEALAAFAVVVAGIKIGDFFKDGIQNAIKFGNEAYFAAQKLNGYDPGKLFIVQKALQASGLSAQEARSDIEEFAQAGRPLEQIFKGGQAGFADSLSRAAREYGTQAAALSKAAEEFAYVQMQIDNVSTKLQGFFVGLADKVLPPLSGLISEIDKVDLVGIGEKFGGYIVDAVNTVRGLIQNGNLMDTLKAGLVLGFQEASNYLLGAINSAVDILTSASTWKGLGETLVGVLGIVGSFLTNLFLGIGKVLLATLQAGIEQLRGKYSWVKDLTDKHADLTTVALIRAVDGKKGVDVYMKGIDEYNKKNNYSSDVAENIKTIDSNSAIIAMGKLSQAQLDTGIQTAKGGVADLADIKPTFEKAKLYDTSESEKKLVKAIADALAQGRATQTPNGQMNPVFSEKADPFHVIADSLARVGGGGRYIQTGLGIAQKAALDTARNTKQMADIMKLMIKQSSGAPRAGSFAAMSGGW